MSKLRSIFRPFYLKFYPRLFWHYAQTLRLSKYVTQINHFKSVALLSLVFTSSSSPFPANLETEKQISQMITQAEKCILERKFSDAKTILNSALKVADDNQAYGNMAYMCDLLSSVILSEGEFFDAEDILVRFIEKLQQLGYAETHNSIIKFKLKLARLYQIMGSSEMAEYGFRHCITAQENKMGKQKQLDDESEGIYLSALFWYAKLLSDRKEYDRSKREYKRCLDRLSNKSRNVLPSQKMVVLHNIAGVSAILNDYDSALNYLYDAIEICLIEDPENKDLPVLVVQVGVMYLKKGLYDDALFWCQTGHTLASNEENKLAKAEGEKCIDELRKLNIIK